MQEIHEEVYDEVYKELVRRELISNEPSTFMKGELTKNFPKLKESLAEWQDILQYRVVELSENPDYERALVLVMQARSRHKKQKQSSSILGGIVAKKRNGEIEIRYGSFKTKFFNDLFYRARQARELTAEHVSDMLAKSSTSIFNKTNIVKSIPDFKTDLEEGIVYAPRFWRQQQTRFMKRLSLNKRFSSTISYIIGNVIEEVASKRLLQAFADFEQRSVIANDADWILSSKDAFNLDMLTIYNHLQQAPNEQSKEFRKGALSVLQTRPAGYFLYSTTVWEGINQGLSPFKAIANFLQVREATVKRIYKNSDWIDGENHIKKYAPYLDVIDPQFWPENNDQFTMFRTAVDMAEIYEKTFDKESKETLKSWIKIHKKLKTLGGGFSWNDMVKSILKPQIERVILDKYGACGDIPDTVRQEPGHNIFKKSFEQFKRDITDIDHMKADIRKRLMQPMALIALENRGIRVSDANVLDGILAQISMKLYEGMTPSDQIKASSYWHSPHVDVQRRFNSAVMNSGGGYKEWEPLFEGEYWEAKNGVRFYPLVSAEALRNEGQAMSHCVGSYASSCMTNNYHIMSLVDKAGKMSCPA